MNHYEVLEVSQTASPEVIKAAYKSLMQLHHPDRNPGDAKAVDRSVAVALAYEVLSDPSRRAAYDLELKQRSVVSPAVEARARHIVAMAAQQEKETAAYGWMWLLLIPIAMIGWLAYSLGNDGGAPSESSRTIQDQTGAEGGAKPTGAEKYMSSSQSRTIPVLFKDIQVSLPSPVVGGVDCSLSVRSIGIVAGGFDPDKFLPFVEENRDYIQQKLAARLATLSCAELMGLNGAAYLKQSIFDSLDEITGTRQGGAISIAERYGVAEVLLPDSYHVTFR
jgi:curved DNA-binding protein CbpA